MEFSTNFLRSLEQLKIHTRKLYLGTRQGIHQSSRRGFGLEFADFRPYTPGDDFRAIDWGAYARSDRLFVKEFREEQDINVLVIVDGSASMNYPNQERKFETAQFLALSLSYVALAGGDTVSYCLSGIKSTPRFRGLRSFARLKKEIAGLDPKFNGQQVKFISHALSQIRTPGKCFYISDLLFDPKEIAQTIDLILGRNFDLSLIQILAPSEMTLQPDKLQGPLLDSESGELSIIFPDASSSAEYAKELNLHLSEITKLTAQKELRHLLVSSSANLEDIVLKELPRVGLLK
ncbi:DUF58 domain-containing protein [bacterium]|nr:DUF58 domain-containing protein [bacterium]